MLLAENEAQVLPTLVSRCVTINMRLLPEADMIRRFVESEGWSQEKASFLAKLGQGAIGRAVALEPQYEEFLGLVTDCLGSAEKGDRARLLEMAQAFEKKRDLTEVFLDSLVLVLRDRAASGGQDLSGLEAALRAVALTRKSFQSNVNPRLAMEVLFLQLTRCFQGGAIFPVFRDSSLAGGF
jgi:hypothetical protein